MDQRHYGTVTLLLVTTLIPTALHLLGAPKFIAFLRDPFAGTKEKGNFIDAFAPPSGESSGSKRPVGCRKAVSKAELRSEVEPGSPAAYRGQRRFPGISGTTTRALAPGAPSSPLPVVYLQFTCRPEVE